MFSDQNIVKNSGNSDWFGVVTRSVGPGAEHSCQPGHSCGMARRSGGQQRGENLCRGGLGFGHQFGQFPAHRIGRHAALSAAASGGASRRIVAADLGQHGHAVGDVNGRDLNKVRPSARGFMVVLDAFLQRLRQAHPEPVPHPPRHDRNSRLPARRRTGPDRRPHPPT